MMSDLRYALRMLIKTPGFALIAILAVALGIGATTTSFSIVNAVLLRPFPFMQNQDRLVYLTQYFQTAPDLDNSMSFPDFLEIKKQATTLEGFGAWTDATFIINNGDKPERLLGPNISATTFSFLGVEPILGRQFRPEEENLNAAPVALIAYHVWQNLFGGDPAIVGRQVPINGHQVIIGVMPKEWRFPRVSDIWMPLQLNEHESPRGNYFLAGIGLLKKGVSIEQARAEMHAIAGRIAVEYPATNTGCDIRIKTFRDEMIGPGGKHLTLLIMGAVIFVHLIACANVANLLLARATSRRREVAVRCALGAGRWQIVRGLLAESLVLGLAGSALGLLFAVWGVDLMKIAIPIELPYWLHFNLDWRVFAFALGTGLLSSVIFGLVPAWQISKPALVDSLKEGGRSGVGAKGQRVRNGLVVAEVALSLSLLIGAGLMIRSFLAVQNFDIGIDPKNMLTFRVGLPPSQYPDKQVAARVFEQLLPELLKIPGVESAAATTSLPSSNDIGADAIVLRGDVVPKQLQDSRFARTATITPAYLQTCRIPLLRGRDFTVGDNKDAPRVVLIDERAAEVWYPNQDPIGQQLRGYQRTGEPGEWATIVGVVRRVIYASEDRQRALPAVYTAEYQQPEPFMSVMLRTSRDPKSYVNAARSAVLAINKDLPIYRIFTMDEIVANSFWEKKFFGDLFAVFAGLALFLAAIGLYGVMAYSVRQRTQEIGVRMALGAQARDVFRLVTLQGVRLIVLGLAIGFVASYFLTKLMASSLEVSAHDPLSFAIVGALLFTVALFACYLPARSAMRLDPIEALRHE
jgi:putative ABC transport system permease protein